MRNRELYPDNWESEIRPAILTRDGFKCTQCGIRQNTPYYVIRGLRMIVYGEFERNHAKANNARIRKIGLQIAHLDQNPSNNDHSNLKAMCPACHLTFDNQFNKAKRLMR